MQEEPYFPSERWRKHRLLKYRYMRQGIRRLLQELLRLRKIRQYAFRFSFNITNILVKRHKLVQIIRSLLIDTIIEPVGIQQIRRTAPVENNENVKYCYNKEQRMIYSQLNIYKYKGKTRFGLAFDKCEDLNTSEEWSDKITE